LEKGLIEVVGLAVLVLSRQKGLAALTLRWLVYCVPVRVQGQYPRIRNQHPREAQDKE